MNAFGSSDLQTDYPQCWRVTLELEIKLCQRSEAFELVCTMIFFTVPRSLLQLYDTTIEFAEVIKQYVIQVYYRERGSKMCTALIWHLESHLTIYFHQIFSDNISHMHT